MTEKVEKAKSECWSEWSYTGAVLLADCSIKQGLSDRMTCKRLFNENPKKRAKISRLIRKKNFVGERQDLILNSDLFSTNEVI